MLNVGSSTLKAQVVYDDGQRSFDEELELPVPDDVLEDLLGRVGSVGAVGHRIVHGGERHVEPELVTDALLGQLDALTSLAPLHLPPALDLVRAVRRAAPDLPAVACYDTAFHATIPDAAHLYAVPAAWEDRLRVRRYGFHGLSHRYASHRAAELLGRDVAELRTVTCHLGAGSSLAAVDGGRSVDTTMGFTPLAGVVMATRPGDLDPGVVLWLQSEAGLDRDEVEDALWHRSGLAGLSRRSGDLRQVLAGIEEGDERCRLALDVYGHRLRAGIASMAAALDGVDAVVFTGGGGGRGPQVGGEAVGGLGVLGLSLDADANRHVDVEGSGDVDVTGDGAVRTLVVHAREDLEISRQVRSVVV